MDYKILERLINYFKEGTKKESVAVIFFKKVSNIFIEQKKFSSEHSDSDIF